MNKETFEKIMSDDALGGSKLIKGFQDDNVFLGLQIIRKYLPNKGIEGADHDIIYSVDVDELLEAGITEEDVSELRALNWMMDDDNMACFV